VASTALNVFHLSGFNAIANKADGPLRSRVEDVRTSRAAMLSLDLPPAADDGDSFIAHADAATDWLGRVRKHCQVSHEAAATAALTDLGLDLSRVGLDELRTGQELALVSLRFADARDGLMTERSVKISAGLTRLRH
jgi:hypothetical protein